MRLAEAHMATDDRRAAAAAIQKAYATADRLGAQPLAQKAAALAHRARLSPAPSIEGGEQAPAGQPATANAPPRFGLTDRERQVLEMLAPGRSNPEIAKALHMSDKTASVHMSKIPASRYSGWPSPESAPLPTWCQSYADPRRACCSSPRPGCPQPTRRT